MKGSDITYLLTDVPLFGKVLAIDELNLIRKGKAYVVNSKPRSHPGLHWIVIDFTGSRPFLFDSFGQKPTTYGLPRTWNYWKYPLQDYNGETCGVYCVYYITCKNNGQSHTQMMKMFSANRKRNDYVVTRWLNQYWL